jgi:putative RNA 2'-phosphotransferase
MKWEVTIFNKMNDKNIIRISKYLSLILRHQPDVAGIQLDENGWTNVNELIERIHEERPQLKLDLEVLDQVVETNNKKRFAFSEDKTSIRASQGNSLKIDMQFEAVDPPEFLYHGTATRFGNSIRKQGLQKRGRQHVHLSAERETAISVGSRHGVPVILTVSSKTMQQAGHEFYRSANGVWLTDHVPNKFLEG